MTVYWIAFAFFALIGLACVLSYAAVATLVYIERRNARHDAEDAEVFGPREVYGPAVDWTFGGRLPSPDATDSEWDDWERKVIGLRVHPTAERIRDRIVANEAARIDTEWQAWGGESA